MHFPYLIVYLFILQDPRINPYCLFRFKIRFLYSTVRIR